jgi:hypothetical protein
MATQNNRKMINRKEWQMMTPAPVATAAGAFMIAGQFGYNNLALYVLNATTQYLYHHDEDAFVQVPSLAMAGTFGAGACGALGRWSNTLTANGGSTTTCNTATGINGLCVGKTIRFLTGLNAGREAVISNAVIIPGGTNVIQFPALPSAVANTDTFVINTGIFYLMNAGTIAAGIFKSYDPLTGVVTSLATAGLPAWGTDGALITTPSTVAFAIGTATAGGASTLTNSAKTWEVNSWTNYQVRITAGTGIGQVRNIASNTATAITTSTAWTTAPDATSQYALEGNDDNVYLLGNNAVTVYKYNRTANTWATMAPTVARAGAPIAGMGAVWVEDTEDVNWDDESAHKDGRYIYSFRGGSSVLDRFDIAGGTAGAGAWQAVTYSNAQETFSTGSSYVADFRYIYIRKDATHRFFKYSVRGNYLEPLATNVYADGVALLGNKLWVKDYDGTGSIRYLYSMRNTGTELFRMQLF